MHGNDVEATGQVGQIVTQCKEILRRGDDALLLARRDRLACAAVTDMSPVAHFHEHELRSIAHDEIDLTVATAMIARDEFQSMLQQVRLGATLESAPPQVVTVVHRE